MRKRDNWFLKAVLYSISLLVRKHPNLHKMDNLCIDFKKKIVKYEWDQRRTNVLRTHYGAMGKYTLEEETVKKLRGITEKRHVIGEGTNEKVINLQDEVNQLKASLRSQYEKKNAYIEPRLLRLKEI